MSLLGDDRVVSMTAQQHGQKNYGIS